jgi:hypothetical protein
VASAYKRELNIKIQGAGVGGCDVILQPGSTDPSSCWCLWGTVNYSFCAYDKMTAEEIAAQKAGNYTAPVQDGRCPIVTGESLVCSDLSSLGNCYNGAYSCTVDSAGLCHCETV